MQFLGWVQRRDLLEIMEDRYNRRSTIIVSQVPVDHWHEIIGDPTIADAILDRLVHNAHKVQLRTKIAKRKEELRILFNPAGCSRNSACRSHHSGHLTV